MTWIHEAQYLVGTDSETWVGMLLRGLIQTQAKTQAQAQVQAQQAQAQAPTILGVGSSEGVPRMEVWWSSSRSTFASSTEGSEPETRASDLVPAPMRARAQGYGAGWPLNRLAALGKHSGWGGPQINENVGVTVANGPSSFAQH